MGCIGFLVYRFNAVFNVPKTRAAVVSILCFVAGIPFFVMGDAFPMIGLACWFYAFIYGCIWFFKFDRDKRLIEQAKVAKPQSAHQVMPDMTTPGSSRLFVPKQPDRH